MEFNKYKEKLNKSELIYKELFGKPRTHKEWAEKFNILGKINRLL